MDQQSTSVVIERISALGVSGVAAFDADGTLWSGDIGDDLFHAMLAGDAFLPSTRDALAKETELAHIRPGITPTATVRSLFDAFQRGTYPELRLLEVVAWGLAGRSAAEVRTYVRDVLAKTRAVERVNEETLTVVRALQQRSIPVYVVSASPREVVEEAVRDFGITPDRVVAATAVYENGAMVADVERPITYGPGKVLNLRKRIGDTPILAAFGDNTFDADMLRAAHVPVAVRPKPGLRQLEPTIPGIVELALGL